MLLLMRRFTDTRRTPPRNVGLGAVLAFVAGAANAGGFLAVGQYTSHMTGIVSAMADHLVLGQLQLAIAGLCALLAFLGGAMTTAVIVNWAGRRRLRSQYSMALLLEAALLLLFGLLGPRIGTHLALLVPVTVLLLCYIMGLQNAVITKISRAEIRTTHITGLVTDLGIELGKLVYYNRRPAVERVLANRAKLRIQARLIAMFFAGALAGAIGFKQIGYAATVPLAVPLVLLSLRPLLQDLRVRHRLYRRRPLRAR